MRAFLQMLAVSGMLILNVAAASAAADDGAFVLVFKDGHRQSVAASEVDHIDVKTPAAIVYRNGRRERLTGDIERIDFAGNAHAATPGHSHFVGKWEVEDGAGKHFYITLDNDGDARKSLGSPHGTWSLVDGEARIRWEDGWCDVIAKVGTRHEKRAYEPGRSLDDTPSNVTYARNTAPKPI